MKTGKIAVLVFVGVVVTFLIYGGALLFLTWPISELSIGKSGSFGDSFGVLTSIFSGFAFAGVIWTVLSQREELNITRNELKSQGFENALFQMLKLHNQLIDEIDFVRTNSKGNTTTKGRDCFVIFGNRLQRVFLDLKRTEPTSTNEKDIVKKAYSIFWTDNNNELGHYFRFLYRIFKYIDESGGETRFFYAKIVRAQLSDQELLLIFYNSLGPYGENFKPFIETYELMDNLREELLFDKAHKELISPDLKLFRDSVPD